MSKPIFKITGLSELAQKRVLSITVTDEKGLKGDKVQIRLDDRDYALETPAQGTMFDVYLGYEYGGPPLTMLGTFQLDEVKFIEAQACTMEISGNAQYHVGNEVKAPKTETWDEKKLGDIFSQIAEKNGYKPDIDPALSSIFVDHLDQTEESDIFFSTRIADKHDAYVKFQDGKMIVRPRNKGVGTVIIKKGIGVQFSMEGLSILIPTSVIATVNSRNKYGTVRAFWQDHDKVRRTGEVAKSGEGPEFQIRQTFETKEQAQLAATAKLSQLNRGTGTIDTLSAPGDPNVRAGMDLYLDGFRPDINGKWLISNVTHTLDQGGYKISLSAEMEKNLEGGSSADTASTGEESGTE